MRLILASLCFSVIVVVVAPAQNGGNKNAGVGGRVGQVVEWSKQQGQKIKDANIVERVKDQIPGRPRKTETEQQTGGNKNAGVGGRVGQVVEWSKQQGQKIKDANIVERVKDQIPGRPRKTETEQQVESKHPRVPCVQHCANLFGFVFESLSTDRILRFSEGIIIPITKGIEVEGTQTNPENHSSLVNVHKHIPAYCKCEATDGFASFLEDNELDIEIFNFHKNHDRIQAAVDYIYDGTVKLNKKYGAKTFTYIDHRGLMTLMLAEMKKVKIYDPDQWMYPERAAINIQ